MSEIPICLVCGNDALEMIVFNNNRYYICWICDDFDENDEPCFCKNDCMNPQCPSCF